MAEMHDETPYRVQVSQPVIRPNEAELDEMARLLNAGDKIAIYGGSGCAEAHDQVVALAARLQARWPSRRGPRTSSNTTTRTRSA